jgi:hypothetical protein
MRIQHEADRASPLTIRCFFGIVTRTLIRAVARMSHLLHVAVVHDGPAICFVTAAGSADELSRRLLRYVREQAPLQLWDHDVAAVRELAEGGNARAAVEHYFRTVGSRWDRERLFTAVVPASEA